MYHQKQMHDQRSAGKEETPEVVDGLQEVNQLREIYLIVEQLKELQLQKKVIKHQMQNIEMEQERVVAKIGAKIEEWHATLKKPARTDSDIEYVRYEGFRK